MAEIKYACNGCAQRIIVDQNPESNTLECPTCGMRYKRYDITANKENARTGYNEDTPAKTE